MYAVPFTNETIFLFLWSCHIFAVPPFVTVAIPPDVIPAQSSDISALARYSSLLQIVIEVNREAAKQLYANDNNPSAPNSYLYEKISLVLETFLMKAIQQIETLVASNDSYNPIEYVPNMKNQQMRERITQLQGSIST